MGEHDGSGPFSEDMSLKREWFRRTHGDLSHDEAGRKLAAAHAGLRRLDLVAGLTRRPGGGPPKEAFEVTSEGGPVRAAVVDNPMGSASANFASRAWRITGDEQASIVVKLRLDGEATARLDRRTAR